MATIYVDKYTPLETMNSVLRIRHHSEPMQIQTVVERDDIRSISLLKPEYSIESPAPLVVALATADDHVVMIPVR